MKFSPFIYNLIFSLLYTINSQAQTEQVAFLPSVFEINASLRKEKQVLEKYADGFQKATLLREASGAYLIRVDYSKRSKSWMEQYPISSSELQDLRNALSGSSPENPALNQNQTAYNGRYYLITSVTAHSIAQGVLLSNVMTTTRTEYYPGGSFTYTEKTRFGRAFPLLVSAGAFTSSLFITRNKPITASAANMHFFGSMIGYGHGIGLGILSLGEDFFEGEGNAPYVFTSLASLAEGWGMYYLAKKNNFDYARSAAWNTGNFWGSAIGSLANGVITGFEEGSPRSFGASMLAGAAGGMLLMNMLQKNQPRTTGDLRAVNAAGFIGAAFGLSTIEESSGRGASASLLLGSGMGLAGAYLLTNHTSFDNAEGALIVLGSLVGGLSGAGISIVADAESFSGPVVLTATGAAVGWGVSYLFFKNRNRRDSTRGMGLEKKRQPRMDFNFNPVGIGMLQQSEEQQIRMLQQNVPAEMLGLKMTF